MKVLITFLLVIQCCLAQEGKGIVLTDAESIEAAQLWKEKREADRNWAKLQFRLWAKYVTALTLVTSGDLTIPINNPFTGWEFGIDFTPDFRAMVPKAEAPKPLCVKEEQ